MTTAMTGRERMLAALSFQETDRPPHFEIMFQLEYEAFGLHFPEWNEWTSATGATKDRLIGRCMEIYQRIVERYKWDALAVYFPWGDPDGIRAARNTFGTNILIGGIIGDTTWAIENIKDWMAFATDLAGDHTPLHEIADQKTRRALAEIDRLVDAGADFIHIVNDVAFNQGPFISPEHFHEIITPYLARQVEHVRKRGALPFVHTDGNIMPVLDDYLSLGAACFQSVDPMAGMDIAEVKRRCMGRMALMGNVQCSYLQEGPLEAIKKSALYALENAAAGGGYIFGSSNTIFPSVPLEHYEFMLQVFREFNAARSAIRETGH